MENTHPIENPQVILSWNSPVRAYRRKTSGVIRYYLALAALASFVAYFFSEIILVLPIWAAVFLFYVLTVTPPPSIENRISRFGITSGKNTYRWEYLSFFYYAKKFDYYIITVVQTPPFENHIYLVVKDETTLNTIIHVLSEHIIYQDKPNKSITDKLADAFLYLMPDEATTKEDVSSTKKQESLEHQTISPTSELLHQHLP